MSRYKWSHRNLLDPNLTTSVDVYYKRNKFVLEKFETMHSSNLSFVKTDKLFCNNSNRRCTTYINNLPLYLDDDHLSDYGSDLVVNEIIDIL